MTEKIKIELDLILESSRIEVEDVQLIQGELSSSADAVLAMLRELFLEV